MELKTFYASGVSHFSYMVKGDSQAVVIDPKRDIEDYLATASEWQVPITHILVTHNHADFAAGQLRLSRVTRASILMGPNSRVAHDVDVVNEGERIPIGSVDFAVIATSGHTPEHVSYLLTDHASCSLPMAVFTGDSLFSGDVGRPDLFGPDVQESLTEKLFDTVQKYRAFEDGLLVYPAHGAGSLCGKRIGQRNPSSIGFEKQANPMLRIDELPRFKEQLFAAMPSPPTYYFATAKKNASGEGLDKPYLPPLPMTPAQLAGWEGTILDLRDQAAFAMGHIPDSLNTAMDPHFSLLVGFAIDPHAKIALIGGPSEIATSALTLYRMGYDRVDGFLAGGIDAWRTQARPLQTFRYVTAKETETMVKTGEAMLLDVRTESERAESWIPNSTHVPLARLRQSLSLLPKQRPTIVIQCGHGCRGSLAASILRSEQFFNVANLAGGLQGWRAAGLPVEK